MILNGLEQVIPYIVQKKLKQENILYEDLREIRIRILCPVIVYYEKGFGKNIQELVTDIVADSKIIQGVVDKISNYSMYAFSQETRQGYITIEGGHRVGISGKTITETDSGGNIFIRGIKYINFINIRVSHEISGCSRDIIKYLAYGDNIKNTLIIAPPGRGKTTMLRDIIRNISDGTKECSGKKVGVVDERGELSGSCQGVPQMKLGIRTDIVDGCTKQWGIRMLIRSMSPQVIAVDEIGLEKDLEAIKEAVCSGISIMASIHGSSLKDITNKWHMKEFIDNKIFERYIIMEGEGRVGKIKEITGSNGEKIAF